MKYLNSYIKGVLTTIVIFLFMAFSDHSHYDYADKYHSHSDSHNHDWDYSDKNHTHSSGFNSYADENHTHDYGYTAYADKNHNHDGSYFSKDYLGITAYAEQSDLEDLEYLVESLKRRISSLENE
ncbi:hypothetical protein OAH62_01485 [Candidatus Marinimicrobia bacterium]|nr:hypothetical protein [Candidatus Neomarinimicrobiota bacterium]